MRALRVAWCTTWIYFHVLTPSPLLSPLLFMQVYDARALRVVVHDADGLLQREAIAACYKLLPAVHRLWRKIPGEEDDYMVTPKVRRG